MESELFETLLKYFTHLSQFGYVKDSDVSIIVLLVFIADFLTEYAPYIKELDLLTILKILTCLQYKSCLYTPLNLTFITEFINTNITPNFPKELYQHIQINSLDNKCCKYHRRYAF